MARTDKLSSYKTKVTVNANYISVKYHNTLIVEVFPSMIVLRTGGYASVTTKRKMNQASHQFGLNYSVYQKNFDWFVVTPHGETLPFNEREITFARRKRVGPPLAA